MFLQQHVRGSLGDDSKLFGNGSKVGLIHVSWGKGVRQNVSTNPAIVGMSDAGDEELDLLGGILGARHFCKLLGGLGKY